jgi:Spy/CpxP family protein refolding chaperone
MLAMKWMVTLCFVGATCGWVTAAKAAEQAPAAVEAMRDTPLGRLISGNIGRLITLRSEANVTPEQRQKVRAVLTSHKAEIGDVAKDLVAKRRALREAVRADARGRSRHPQGWRRPGPLDRNAAVVGSKVRGELKTGLHRCSG